MDYETCLKRETRRLRWQGIKFWLTAFGVLAATLVLPVAAYLIFGGIVIDGTKCDFPTSVFKYWLLELMAAVVLAIPAVFVMKWLDYTKREAEGICRKRMQEKREAENGK